MSRIGRKEIILPAGVTLSVDKRNLVTVSGKKGTLTQEIDKVITVHNNENNVTLTRVNDVNTVRAKHGLYRALIANMVEGVTNGYSKTLTIKGVGYKMAVAGNKINFNLGFSHPIEFPLPQGISAVAEGNNLTISGIDKQLVGEIAAQIRKLRVPEPYKGKGIKYSDEVIRRKAGKAAAK